MEELNRKWELLSQLHMRQIAQPPADANGLHSVLAFPLSFVVEKCYKYDPLIVLGKAMKNYKYAKNQFLMQFQIVFFPYGYNECEHEPYLNKSILPNHRVLIRCDSSKNFVHATKIQHAFIAFLSEPFVLDKDLQNLDKEDFPQDENVIHSIQMNSSVWIIGPFVPACDTSRLYYRIAAGATYRSSADGSFVHYIRSLCTDDKRIPSASWKLDLLEFPKNDPCPVDHTSINSRRLGVMLMSTIQQLSLIACSKPDLYLQTDYNNQSFLYFISIGFWYSSLHLELTINGQRQASKGYPLCCNVTEELPKTLHELVTSADLGYITTPQPGAAEIRLLTMKKVLLEFFPPMRPVVDYPMLTEWLYSVPFPSPPQSSSWNHDEKYGILHCIENIIPNKSTIKMIQRMNYKMNLKMNQMKIFHSWHKIETSRRTPRHFRWNLC